MNLTALHASIVVALLVMTAGAFAGDTAYSALRVVGAKHGEEAFHRVLEIRGRDGAWNILLADSRARAGARDIEVRDGRIVHESKLTKAKHPGTPLNLELLNLDSDGVLTTANQETEEAAAAERIDYTLSNGMDTNTPVWTVALHNQREEKVTTMQIAADTGAVIAKSVASARDDAPFATETEEEQFRKKQTSSRSHRSSPDAPDVIGDVVKHVERARSLLKRFLP